MNWKAMAKRAGWKEAWDYDVKPKLLVVWHPEYGIHFAGKNAWRLAAGVSEQVRAWKRSLCDGN